MKKFLSIITATILLMITAVPALAASSDDASFSASNDFENEIRADISSDDIQSWTDSSDAILNYDYMVPVFSTLNVENSNTLEDTLEFTNAYNIPVSSNGNCIGVFKVVIHNGKWVISSYTKGLDFLTAVKQYDIETDRFIEIPQVSGDFGFLRITDVGESYQSISSQHSALSNESTQEILKQIKDADMSGALDGSGLTASTTNFILYYLIGSIVIISVIVGIIFIRRIHNAKITK